MKIIYFWKPIIWLIIICYLSLMPGNGLPPVTFFNIPHFDKVVHLGFYFVLTLFLIKPISQIVKQKYLLSGIIAALISGLIEILQEYAAIMREGDIYDFLANLSGVILASVLYKLFIDNKKTERYF